MRLRLLFATALIIAACGDPGQGSPQTTSIATTARGLTTARGTTINYSTYLPAVGSAPYPVVILKDGNPGNGNPAVVMTDWRTTLLNAGYAVVAVAINTTNSELDFPDAVDQVVDVVNADPQFDPDRIALMGHSGGSTGVVLVAGATAKPACRTYLSSWKNPAVDAVIGLSPKPQTIGGRCTGFDPGNWAQLIVPSMAVTGDNDVAAGIASLDMYQHAGIPDDGRKQSLFLGPSSNAYLGGHLFFETKSGCGTAGPCIPVWDRMASAVVDFLDFTFFVDFAARDQLDSDFDFMWAGAPVINFDFEHTDGPNIPQPRVGINGAPCAFATIGDAVLAASSGDVIHASPHTYVEDTISLSSFTVTIGSADATCSTLSPTSVVVEPTAGQRLFDINDTVLTLKGLTVRNGSIGGSGGLLQATNGSTVNLDDTTFSDGWASSNGGCIYALGSNVNLTNGAELFDCEALGAGGALYMSGGSLNVVAGTSIRNSTAGSVGGGLYVGGMEVEIAGDISNNHAVLGGGLFTIGTGGVAAEVEVYGSARIDGNSASGNGGGAYAAASSALRIGQSAIVVDNTAVKGAGIFGAGTVLNVTDDVVVQNNVASGDGGGIAAYQSTVDIFGSGLGAVRFLGNEAGGNGGGLHLEGSAVESMFARFDGNVAGSAGGGVAAVSGTTGMLLNGQYWSNSAGDGGGGGVYLMDAGTSLKIRSNYANCDPTVLAKERYCSEMRANSTTGTGGGVKVIAQASVIIRTTAFVANDSPLNGEAVMVYSNMSSQPSDALIVNSLFIDHASTSAPAVGGTNSGLDVRSCTFSNNTYPVVYFVGSAGPFHRNVVWGNTNDAITTGISGDCNVTQTLAGTPAGVNNTQLDPLFDASNPRSSFKLQAGSAAIDACAVGPQFDLDGTRRRVGPAFDKGAFEMP